jgi:hypothetical protein
MDEVQTMRSRKLIEPERLHMLFSKIEPELYRFPAIDAADFCRSVEAFLASS